MAWYLAKHRDLTDVGLKNFLLCRLDGTALKMLILFDHFLDPVT
jgi:hypothetical protein